MKDSGISTAVSNFGESLVWMSSIVGLFEFIRQWLHPQGFAVIHLNWSPRVVGPIREGLIYPQLLFFPLLFVAILFGSSGLSLDTISDLQRFHNSLGRMAFVVGLTGFGLSLIGALRPRNWSFSLSRRVSLYTIPVVLLTFLVPSVLAIAGYYLTGYLLAYQMLRTLWWVGIVLIVGGLLFRWFEGSRQKIQQPAVSREEEDKNGQDTPFLLRPKPEDVSLAESRAFQLTRFIIILLLGIGLISIWSEALPALQLLKRIQVWPDIRLVETTEPISPLEVAEVDQTDQKIGSAEESNLEIPVPENPTGDSSPTTLMLWNLLKAILAGIITGILVANLPGALEFLLLRRTILDSGARIALITLVRYSIMILGIIITFSYLGIGWSKVQWLVAALTFGLGFGLQEIVANFVSGLILLLERPIRVGDVITIGTLQGKVTNTRIRATTITLWDRSEMVVPNKEFITQKLINWTLSDSKRRLDIPVRVAYGTSVQKVKDVLIQVAQQHPDILDDPAPQILLLEFGDDALKFELRVFLEFGQGLRVGDELRMEIDRAFKEQGIEFALPQLSLKFQRRRNNRDSATNLSADYSEEPKS